MGKWWQSAVFYQIYPRSFKDSDGDGVGDLRGIIEKLDYFNWLGVDALWLSPIFTSPMVDFGYDVSDYRDIDPLFGRLADFDELLKAAHGRGLKVILDLVPNHTSNMHPWFLESRSSRDNPKRDWYIWRDAKPDGSEPNNWLAYFGGAAWTWDELTGQYYMHNFAPEQPELNYFNPEVKAAMFDEIRFWLERGLDGFRIDTIDRLIKDPEFRNNPPSTSWKPGDNPSWKLARVYSEKGEGIHDLIAEMGDVFREFGDAVSVGEIDYSTDPHYIAAYVGTKERPEIDLPFNFAPIMLPWNAQVFRKFVDEYDGLLPGSGTNYVLGNHDQMRLASRFGEGFRTAAMLLLTLRGAAFIYQGEELGMTDGEVMPEQYRDPQGINLGLSRDPCRTPFHWTGDHNAGFTDGTPWLPIALNHATVNVEAERDDPFSTLTLYRRLLALRRAAPALNEGSYRSFDAGEDVFAYIRQGDDSAFAVLLNFSADAKQITLPANIKGNIRLTTLLDREGESVQNQVALRPYEGMIIGL
ncbi:MAG: alpha-D-1,4-glucosidase [Chloroflexi bacterium OLB15]|nr:MAG: alpha-D-1,4-glucosidase [Chloroflexi bacterium OLB15]